MAIGLPVAAWMIASSASEPVCPATPVEVTAAVDAAREARGEDFAPARESARATLRCVDGPISPGLAASVHSLEAMASLRHRDLGDVVDHFQAGALAAPGTRPGAEYPPGHAMADLAKEARERSTPDRSPLPVATGHTTRVDGHLATSRYHGLPAVVQVVGPSGDVRWTDLVAPDAFPPTFEPVRSSRAQRAWRTATLSSTAATAVFSGVAWTLALSAKAEMRGIAETAVPHGENPAGEAELRTLQSKANRWGVAAQVGSGMTLGLTAATVVVWW